MPINYWARESSHPRVWGYKKLSRKSTENGKYRSKSLIEIAAISKVPAVSDENYAIETKGACKSGANQSTLARTAVVVVDDLSLKP